MIAVRNADLSSLHKPVVVVVEKRHVCMRPVHLSWYRIVFIKTTHLQSVVNAYPLNIKRDPFCCFVMSFDIIYLFIV